MLINDRRITITVGASRKATVWRPQVLLLPSFSSACAPPARGTETMAEYLAPVQRAAG